MVFIDVNYYKSTFEIKPVDDGFIIYNHAKPFKEGHTHIEHYRTATWLVDLVIKKKLPYDLCRYHLESLRRLSTDETYQRKIMELLESKKQRKQMYYNSRKK